MVILGFWLSSRDVGKRGHGEGGSNGPKRTMLLKPARSKVFYPQPSRDISVLPLNGAVWLDIGISSPSSMRDAASYVAADEFVAGGRVFHVGAVQALPLRECPADGSEYRLATG